MGEILSAYPRDSYVLATKVYFPMGPQDRGLSRKQILKQIDASLKRLRIDHVDLYQCHRYDDSDAAGGDDGRADRGRGGRQGALHRLQRVAGGADREALALPGVARFVSSQPQYSALWREPEREVFPLCERRASARSCGRRSRRAS